MKWDDKLLCAGAFCTFFSGYLFISNGPASNTPQLAFRVGLLLVGIVLMAVSLVLKSRHGSQED